MPRLIEFEGKQIEFPDDVTDDEIAAALGGGQKPAVDPSQMNRANALVNSAAQGLTFGTSDEIEAGLKTGAGLWGDYGGELESVRARQDALSEEYPLMSLGGKIAGAVAMPFGLAKSGITALSGARGVGSAIGRGMGEGAVYGAAYGAGNAEGGARDRLTAALAGAGQGAAAGGVVSGGSQAISNALTRRAAAKAAPTIDALSDVKDKAYQAVDQSGWSFPKESWDDFVTKVGSVMRKDRISAARNPKAASMLGEIEQMRGMTPSLSEADRLRQVIARDVAGATDPSERRFGQMMIEKLDDLIDTAQGSETLKAARDATRRVKKSEQLSEALMKAERRASSSGSGGNVENAMRQNVRGILDNANKRRGFTAEEVAAMEDFVRGGAMQNMLRLVGKLSPTGSGLMAALGIGGTMANPLLGIPALAGMGAKAMADRGVTQKAAMVDALIRGGGQAPTRAAIPPAQAALVDALSSQAGKDPAPMARRPLELLVTPR